MISCNQDDKDPDVNILGYWNIVSVNRNWSSEMKPDENIDFQERYIFNDDGTFIKFSTKNQISGKTFLEPIQAFGIYEINPITDTDNLFEVILTFETNVVLASNCGSDAEYMILTKDNKLVNNSWVACDGPSFVYQRRKI